MDNAQKIEGFNLILDFISRYQEANTAVPKMIGTLNKAVGQNGFKKAEIGTPVFDTGDRYLVMLESLDGKTNVEVTYYKDTLRPVINFI